MHRFPPTFSVILVFKTVLYDLKLQLTYRSDNLATVKLVNEHLGNTLIHELVYTLGKLFSLHRIIVLDILEHFRRERRKPTEVQLFAIGQSIAYLENSVIRQSDNIAWPCLVYRTLTLCHKLRRRREAYRLAKTHMLVWMIALKTPAAHLAERYTRTVVGINIGRYLENKSGKLRFIRHYNTLLRFRWTRTWSNLYKTIEQLLHTKIIQGTTEKHWRSLGRTVIFDIEFRVNAIYKFKVFT